MRNISTAVRGHYDDDGYMWAIIIRRFYDSVARLHLGRQGGALRIVGVALAQASVFVNLGSCGEERGTSASDPLGKHRGALPFSGSKQRRIKGEGMTWRGLRVSGCGW
jgi:hypothetical protein